MPNTEYTFSVIDSHTGGEPTRVVYGGFPELSGSSLQEQVPILPIVSTICAAR